MKIYGIKNCDTIKKALRWLDANDVDYEFHDYKKLGISKAKLQGWCKLTDWETLLNRRGTTWRKLPDDVKESVNKTSAIKLMVENPSMIKRPVVETGNRDPQASLLVGFDEQQYNKALSAASSSTATTSTATGDK